jgi:hypothetical protein
MALASLVHDESAGRTQGLGLSGAGFVYRFGQALEGWSLDPQNRGLSDDTSALSGQLEASHDLGELALPVGT